MNAADGLSSFILVSLAAVLLPLLASRLRMPAVVVEILFGIVAGPAMLGFVTQSEMLGWFAELGFLLLLFLSGFEIDFNQLERQGPRQIGLALAVFALTLLLSYLAARALGHGPFVTLLLATTSVGLVVPTLRNTRLGPTALGQAILISALLADFLTLIATTVYAIFVEHGVGLSLLNLPILMAAMGAVLVILRRLAWWAPERAERLFTEDDPDELGIRACLGLMFGFVGLAHLLGIEAILGAFLAGTAFAMVFRHRGHLERKLSGLAYGFFVPIFFIHVGIGFDLPALRADGVIGGAIALIVVAFLVKLGAASLLLFARLSLRETFAAGILLAARLSLVIAVAELGARLGLIDRTLEAQVILLAVVTSVVAPTLFRRLVVAPAS